MAGHDGAREAVTLRVDSTHQGVRLVRRWLGSLLRAAECDPDFVGETLLAVGEALTNVVRHAYGEESGHPIEVHVIVEATQVEIAIHDDAPGYTDERIGRLPDPQELAEGGYGLFLIQTIMDEVRREARGRIGNTLRLIKYRTDANRKVS